MPAMQPHLALALRNVNEAFEWSIHDLKQLLIFGHVALHAHVDVIVREEARVVGGCDVGHFRIDQTVFISLDLMLKVLVGITARPEH